MQISLSSKFTQAAVIVGVICLVVIGYQIKSFGSTSKLDAYKTQIENYKKSVDSVVVVSNHLKLINAQILDSLVANQKKDSALTARVKTYQQNNEHLNHVLDSLKSQITPIEMDSVPAPVKVYIAALNTKIDTLTIQNTQLEKLLTIKDASINLLQIAYNNEKTRADSLQSIIIKVPTKVPSDKLFGLIPLPSRTTSFVSGVGTGVALILAIIKR